MLKRIILAALISVMALSAMPVYAGTTADSEVTKYENELYYIGANIPADSYILISKDITKPAYFGVYTNDLGNGAKFDKKRKILIGNESDYIYPHYFEDNPFYSYSDQNVPDNQGNKIASSYFEYSYLVNLSDYKFSDARKDFLYLENCYAIPVKDIDKGNIDINRDGFIPVKGNLVKGKDYKITVANDERVGMYSFYKYDKFTKKPTFVGNYSGTLYNKLYNTGTANLKYGSDTITVPEDADLMLKVGINICDMAGNEIYTSKGIAFPENFEEKYDFKDVSIPLKTVVKQEFMGLRAEEIALRNKPYFFTKTTLESALDRKRIFKNLSGFAKTDADYEYIKYIREAYVMYAQAPYIDILVGKYLYNATSFEDLSKLVRKIAYNDYRSSYYTYVSYDLYKNWLRY